MQLQSALTAVVPDLFDGPLRNLGNGCIIGEEISRAQINVFNQDGEPHMKFVHSLLSDDTAQFNSLPVTGMGQKLWRSCFSTKAKTRSGDFLPVLGDACPAASVSTFDDEVKLLDRIKASDDAIVDFYLKNVFPVPPCFASSGRLNASVKSATQCVKALLKNHISQGPLPQFCNIVVSLDSLIQTEALSEADNDSFRELFAKAIDNGRSNLSADGCLIIVPCSDDDLVSQCALGHLDHAAKVDSTAVNKTYTLNMRVPKQLAVLFTVPQFRAKMNTLFSTFVAEERLSNICLSPYDDNVHYCFNISTALRACTSTTLVVSHHVDVLPYLVTFCRHYLSSDCGYYFSNSLDCNFFFDMSVISSQDLGSSFLNLLPFLHLLCGSEFTPYVSHVGPQKLLPHLTKSLSSSFWVNLSTLVEGFPNVELTNVLPVSQDFAAVVRQVLDKDSTSMEQLSLSTHNKYKDNIKSLVSHIPPTDECLLNHVLRCIFLFNQLYVDNQQDVINPLTCGFLQKGDHFYPQWDKYTEQ